MNNLDEYFKSKSFKKSAAAEDPDLQSEYFKYMTGTAQNGEDTLSYEDWLEKFVPAPDLSASGNPNITEEDVAAFDAAKKIEDVNKPIDAMIDPPITLPGGDPYAQGDGSISDEEAQNWAQTAPENEQIPGIPNSQLSPHITQDSLDSYLEGEPNMVENLDEYFANNIDLPERGSREWRGLPESLRSHMVDRDDAQGLFAQNIDLQHPNVTSDSFKAPIERAGGTPEGDASGKPWGKVIADAAKDKSKKTPGGADGDPSTPWYQDWRYLVPGALGVGGLAAVGTDYLMGDGKDDDDDKKKKKNRQEAYA